MKRGIIILISVLVFVSGCDSIRFVPGEEMKQNAWLHERTAVMAADVASDDGASEQLCDLTQLSAIQSRTFLLDYGLPKAMPEADSADEVLANENWQLASTSAAKAAERPDAWEMAEGAVDLGIGIAGLIGGIWGVRAASFLRQTRRKSKALKEIVEGNELFKRQHGQMADAFKTSQRNQSSQTRAVVAGVKNGEI